MKHAWYINLHIDKRAESNLYVSQTNTIYFYVVTVPLCFLKNPTIVYF